MNCDQAALLLSAQLDQEIQSDDQGRLDDHLRDCAACQATAEAFRLQDADLRRAFAPRRRAAARVADRVLQQFPFMDTPAQPRVLPPRPGQRLPRTRLALASLMALAASVAFLVLWLNGDRPLPQPGGPGGPLVADRGPTPKVL